MNRYRFSAGVARRELPLQEQLDLSGYLARTQPSVGVHDAVTVTSLALAGDNALLLIVSVDVLGFSIEVATSIRRRIEAGLQHYGDWKKIEVCLACTHTHSAPASMNLRGCGTASDEWLSRASDTIVETALESARNRNPARLGTAQADVEGVSLNRRGSTPVDPQLVLWRIDREDNSPLAAVVNFACHPVVYEAENVLISADYPGEMRRVVETKINAPVLFVTGAAGDINPAFRGDESAIERVSTPLAAALENLWSEITTTDNARLDGTSRIVDLQLCDLPERAELESFAADETEPVRSAWARHALSVWGQNLSVPCALQLLRIGDATLAAVGCELFVSLGNRIKSTLAAQGFESVVIAGYANGNLGYVPDMDAYSRGGYEVDTAHYYYAQPSCVVPESGECVVEQIEQMGQSLAEFE